MPPKGKIGFPGPIPKEALDYFKSKGLKIGFNYQDVWQEEHVASFAAAKVMELDVLASLKEIVERAIKEGMTFRQFQKEAGPLLDKSGWSNYHQETPTTHRLATIFDTNMRTARAAGQWQRIDRTKKVLPYLIYELGPSLHHREEHVEWAGIILRVDDPWFDTHAPPNGWGCKCRLRQLSQQEADKKGGVGEAPPSYEVPWVNERTGETGTAPVGVDPSFAFNAGKERLRGIQSALNESEEQK